VGGGWDGFFFFFFLKSEKGLVFCYPLLLLFDADVSISYWRAKIK
jgi:hypothetical protein